jgi:hypothetical protein
MQTFVIFHRKCTRKKIKEKKFFFNEVMDVSEKSGAT